MAAIQILIFLPTAVQEITTVTAKATNIGLLGKTFTNAQRYDIWKMFTIFASINIDSIRTAPSSTCKSYILDITIFTSMQYTGNIASNISF